MDRLRYERDALLLEAKRTISIPPSVIEKALPRLRKNLVTSSLSRRTFEEGERRK